MFENILFQERVVEQLSREIRARSLPASLLFHGPTYSAKLTTALEAARGLSCLKDGAWNCPCEHCRGHRTLDYPWLMIVGAKNWLPEIDAGAGLLEHHRTDPRRYFLIRAVKKLLKRFDPMLWEGEETKLKGVANPLALLQDELETLYPPLPLAEGSLLSDQMQRIREACRTLADALPAAGLPIHQVRKFSAWARTTTSGAPKFVILENADRLQEGARNALLKILEEPPADTWFILLTSQKGAMLPTILSRLRAFAFLARPAEAEQKILQTLFHCETGLYAGLADYFQSFETQKKGRYTELAQEFLAALAQPVYPFEALSKFWGEEDNFRLFLEALANELQQSLLHSEVDFPLLDFQEGLFELLGEIRTRRETYNLGAALLIETLFYRARSLR